MTMSHLHGDHWDRVARRHLDRDLPIVTTPHASRRLKRHGFGRSRGIRVWIDLGVVHLGGTSLLGLATVTMDGAQGAEWTELVGPRRVVPIHDDDYTAFKSPLSDYEDRAREHGFDVHVVERGTSMPPTTG